MGFYQLIISFIVLMAVVCGVIIFWLRMAFISSTEGAVNRLNEEIAKANAQQRELEKKVLQADQDLAKRQAEAKELAEKMRSTAEEESRAEREKIINKAREEGEEIIAKAQHSKEKIRQELEKEADLRAVKVSMGILSDILSQKAIGALDDVFMDEFLEKLKDIDMSRINTDVTTVDVITLNEMNEGTRNKLEDLIKGKLNRSIKINATVDEHLGGGALIKFGSMALDGSMRNLIREKGMEIQEKIEAKTG